MLLKEKLKNTLISLGTVGMLATPQGLDYLINGPFSITHIDDYNIFEYPDKIVISSIGGGANSFYTDYGKDGELDVHNLLGGGRVAFNIQKRKDSDIFKREELRYQRIMKKYKGTTTQ